MTRYNYVLLCICSFHQCLRRGRENWRSTKSLAIERCWAQLVAFGPQFAANFGRRWSGDTTDGSRTFLNSMIAFSWDLLGSSKKQRSISPTGCANPSGNPWLPKDVVDVIPSSLSSSGLQVGWLGSYARLAHAGPPPTLPAWVDRVPPTQGKKRFQISVRALFFRKIWQNFSILRFFITRYDRSIFSIFQSRPSWSAHRGAPKSGAPTSPTCRTHDDGRSSTLGLVWLSELR